MKLFKVSCCSDCGSYFASYLQSVSIIALTPKDAKLGVKLWLKNEGESFIYPEDKWCVEDLGEIQLGRVVDHCCDSDY